MKIADITEFYSEHGGGVRTYVTQKLEASARFGHETVIVAPGPADREEVRPGGKIVWVRAPVLPVDRRYHIFTHARAVWDVLDREQPDVVEGSSPWRGGWIAAGWRGKATKILVMHADPVAVYPHTLLGRVMNEAQIDRLFGWFWSYLRRLNMGFHATVVAGDWLARRFAGFGLQGLAVVPFGVDRAVFTPAARDPAVRAEMLKACGLDSGKVLLAVGRHHPEKRLGVLIDAAAQAGRMLPTGLFIIGDGPTRALVERHAARHAHIHIAGQVNDRRKVAAYMASADGFLHGSASETYGLAVAEALCCGTPIVVPTTGGAGDFADGACGESYRAGDVAAAAGAAVRLLTRDRDTLSRAALDLAQQRIGHAETHFERLFGLYEDLRLKAVPT